MDIWGIWCEFVSRPRVSNQGQGVKAMTNVHMNSLAQIMLGLMSTRQEIVTLIDVNGTSHMGVVTAVRRCDIAHYVWSVEMSTMTPGTLSIFNYYAQ